MVFACLWHFNNLVYMWCFISLFIIIAAKRCSHRGRGQNRTVLYCIVLNCIVLHGIVLYCRCFSLSSHLSLNRADRWDTTDDFATSFLHFSLFSTALWDLANSRSWQTGCEIISGAPTTPAATELMRWERQWSIKLLTLWTFASCVQEVEGVNFF